MRLLYPSDEPGIDVELNREAAHRYPHVADEPPHWHRADDSATDH